jgi:hypothetical protein
MNAKGPPPEFWIGFFVCFGLILVVGLLIQIFFLLTLYRTQSEVAERNREIAPGTIWWTILINFVPIVGSLWSAYLVIKLSDSLRREFEDRGWGTSEGFGRTVGLIWALGGLASALISVVRLAAEFGGLPQVGMLVGILNLPLGLTILVCWIIYWVQMAQYGRQLREGHGGYRAGSIEEDYDDEYRGRRRRDEDEDEGERPRRRRRDEDEDEDERPRRRRDDD